MRSNSNINKLRWYKHVSEAFILLRMALPAYLEVE